MTLSTSRVLADAWALWRQDRNLLVRVAAPFLFLPDYAMKLLLPTPLPGNPATTSFAAAVQAQAQFVGDHLGAYLVQAVAVQFGFATLFVLYASATDVRAALRRAGWLWWRLAGASLLVGVPGTLGLLLVVPGLVVFGRALVTGPALAGERPLSAVGAVARSIRLTRGSTVAVSGLVTVGLLLRFASAPFDQLDLWLRGLNAPNPVALAVIDGAGAGVSALAQIATALIAIAAYRALASNGT